MDSYKNKRDEVYKQKSKDRLARILKKKIQTTMIGALSSVEEHFGFLWDSPEIDNNQKLAMKELYNKLRSDILDKGNHQARNIDVELSQYDVNLQKHQLNLPIIITKEDRQ
jgi:hypothetical protein